MTGPTVGITPDAVGRLAASLDQAVSTAGTVSQAITRIRDRATAAEMSVGQPDPGAISGLIGGLFGNGSEPDGGALRTLTQQAPPVAKEIRARLNHFLACERDNLPISPSLWFTDEPLPDARKVKAAIAYFNAHIGDSGGFLWSDPAQGAQEVLNNWKQLTPSELDAVLNSLTPDQLKKLNGQLGEGSSWWGAGGPDNNVKLGFTNLILSSAGPDTFARIRGYLTELNFNPQLDKNLTWASVSDLPLFGPDGINVNKDLDQGNLGDCYFLSSLAAVATKDPALIKSHIWQNANGTYTVRLYQNGEPTDVTVMADVPWNPNYETYAYAQVPDGTWIALYEKAYAQLRGGYDTIGQGDDPAVALSAITGQQAGTQSWGGVLDTVSGGLIDGPPSLNDIRTKLEKGDALTAATTGDDHMWDQEGGWVVSDHAYRIVSVYTDPHTHQPMIKLANPWGVDGQFDQQAGHDADQYVYLTEAEFQRDFYEVEYLQPGGW